MNRKRKLNGVAHNTRRAKQNLDNYRQSCLKAWLFFFFFFPFLRVLWLCTDRDGGKKILSREGREASTTLGALTCVPPCACIKAGRRLCPEH